MSTEWQTVRGVVIRGHRVASQQSEHYPLGSIEMQFPFFKALGLDLTGYYWGTLNVSIDPYTFSVTAPEYTFRSVHWTSKHPPEDFSFSGCRVIAGGVRYEGWVYYPHPETKKRHFQNPSIVEIIAQRIPVIQYGDVVDIQLNPVELSVSRSEPPNG